MDSLNRHFTARREDFDRPVLVTGSGGCIGSWAIAILVRAGVTAVAFDLDASRRRPGLLSSEEDLDRVIWEQGDIADPDTVDRVVSRMESARSFTLRGSRCRSARRTRLAAPGST